MLHCATAWVLAAEVASAESESATEADPVQSCPTRHKELDAIIANVKKGGDIPSRILEATKPFLGAAFELNPTGEGAGSIDDEPFVVLNRFDCTTFIETVLALAFSETSDDFCRLLSRVRYGGCLPAFENRLHFPYSQWVTENERQGFFRVIKSAPAMAHRERVDVENWFKFMPENAMYSNINFESRESLSSIAEISKRLGRSYSVTIWSREVAKLLQTTSFAKGDIVGFIGLGGDLSRYPGERNSITHMGIVVSVDPVVVIRAASQVFGRVTDASILSITRRRGVANVRAVLLRPGRGVHPGLSAVDPSNVRARRSLSAARC